MGVGPGRVAETRGEGGFTLVELLVAMSLLGVVLGMLLTGVVVLREAAAQVDNKITDQGYARTAMATFSRDIRVATTIPSSPDPALIDARPRYLLFTSALGSFDRPVRVELQVQDDQLIETVTEATAASVAPDLVYEPADAQTRYVARYVTDPTQTFFRYFDRDGTELVPAGSPARLTDAQARQVRRVDIELTVHKDRSPLQRQTTVRTSVRLPNPVG